MHKEGIAVIGLGFRFPGGIGDTESFWKLLVEGREAVGDIPADRWNVERFYDAEPGLPGKSMAKRGGFVDGIDQFDPQFFGISPREASHIDPQQRLLLETAWEAIEGSGMILDFENGTDLAVFVGISHNDYQVIQGTAWDSSGITSHSPTGTAHSIAANRISYCLNLKGPSVAMDTACSSALTAVHAACEHIWTNRGDTAMAGGVTVMITPGGFIGFSQASMLSPDGRCAAFAANANGFVRGEGAGMILLKRLSKAIEDGDPIHGVILGTAMNQDGHTNGISLPSPEAQARLVLDACKDAGVDPAEIGFVEAHGTGTAVGDPIEAHALAEALCKGRAKALPIGSVKTNLGHLETAAGVAGLVKALLVLKHRQIPPSLHFKEPSPHIDFDALKLRVTTELEDFPEVKGARMAGVNSFGFGGANTHVVVAEAPQETHHEHGDPQADRSWPIMLSARSENALKKNAGQLADWIEARSHSNGSSPILPDLTYTLGARRNHHAYRATVVAGSLDDLVAELKAFAAGEGSPRVATSFTPRPEHPPRVGFVLSGQGPQWWGMGRQLMQHEPVFRAAVEKCAAALAPYADFSLLEELARDEADSRLSRTAIAQPALFAMNVALAELWKAYGVQPAAVTGHSVSEVAAAHLAGILTLDEAARVITLRSRFMEECARGEGTMLAVALSEAEARELIARHDRTASISAYNGPKTVTLSGVKTSLEAMAAELEAKGVFARFVRVDHPFHHAMMQPAADALREAIADLQPKEETIPFYSTVTGGRCLGKSCTAVHWGNGIREAVRFSNAVEAMDESGIDVWLEISAHPALSPSMKETLAARNSTRPVIATTRRDREHLAFLDAVLELHRSAVALDFAAMTPSRRLLSLPAYAWDKQRWWSESSEWREGRLAPGGRGLLDCRLARAVPTWIARLDSRHLSYLKDHKVDSHIVYPAAAFIEMALEVGVQYFEGKPFVVEDFEIRKPLILPENPSTVQLEVTVEPRERTFTIQSRFEGASTWSVHVVGSMRGERTESNVANWQSGDALDAVEVEGFYDHMRSMGLAYGEEFRGVRELAAREGRSAGRVALTEASAARAGEYALHPVLMDAALHVFSAGAATIEDRNARLKLPVRFGRILFLRPVGASARVKAQVRAFNDEFLEGDITLFDATGSPCVVVEGFRAIAVSGARRSSPGGTRDIVYHIGWEKIGSVATAPQAPVSLEELRDSAAKALTEVMEARGKAKIEKAMADADQLAAAQICAGLARMGVTTEAAFSVKSLNVAEALEPAFARLMFGLAEQGLVKQTAKGWKAAGKKFTKAAEGAQQALRDYIEANPGHLSEGLLCANVCDELGAILTGEKEAVQVLFSGFGNELLDHFYGDGLLTSHWLATIARLVKQAEQSLPEGKGLRILEIGAGTGGLSAHVLPLLERGRHSYTFTDASAGFFSTAAQKLAAFPEVEFKVYDLEKPALEQDFAEGSFDLIIGTNVVHAVQDLRFTLGNLHGLLAPGGTLAFMDTATLQLWTETVFGLTKGWWRFSDRDLRPESPLIERAIWEKILLEAGFAESTSLAGTIGPRGGEGQIGLFARKAYSETAPAVAEAQPVTGRWLIFNDESGLGEKLAAEAAQRGAVCTLVGKSDVFVANGKKGFSIRPDHAADWEALVGHADNAGADRIVYLWALDTLSPDLMGTDELLHLAQALGTKRPAQPLKLDLVTRDAQPASAFGGPSSPAQAASIGLLRVIRNEYPNITCRGIDLPAGGVEEGVLLDEILKDDPEHEVALRGGGRYGRRMARGQASIRKDLAPAIPMRLQTRERGHLDTLQFGPFELPALNKGEVLIKTSAAGMNFRDVLKALGIYPGEAPDARMFGDEVGGTVLEVGEGVTHVAPGDRVFGLAAFGLATHAIARGADLCKIPDGISFEEAATMPVVFMTSWHSMANVARMRKGEWILVQSGAGGVGMAAIQIAQYMGVEVIATAGNPAKRALLETLGVKHVLDSRRADFTEAVMAITNRRGVDVVLNSLASEAIPMGMACLAEFGRFIEIGKRDIYQNSRIPLWPLRNNASFHVVAMDAVFNGDEELARQLMAEIVKGLKKGALRPLPFRGYPATRVDAAFRLMAQGKHVGKVVVSFPEAFVSRHAEPLPPKFSIKSEGAYLITGAFGGFGRILSDWLVERGAKHLVLAGRSGASTPEAQAHVKQLEARGVTVQVVRADVGVEEDVTRLVQEVQAAGTPLLGLFHLAMAIDDAPLAALNADRMRTVMAPKAHGAWLLHSATKDLGLECFVMFSSVSSIFGNPAQGNYAAANAVLDALTHHRRSAGLPALTVNWGVLGGAGYVARNEKVGEFLARQGTAAISPAEVTALLDSFLEKDAGQMIAIRVDWSKWRQFFRGLEANPMLEKIMAGEMGSGESGHGGSDWRGRLQAASAEERPALVSQAVREVVGGVLRVKPESLRDDQPLTDLGLDSLMGVEIETSLERSIGVALPPTSLMRARTIGQIATLISDHMGAASGAPAPAPAAPVQEEAPSVEEVDLDALSVDDIDSLLDDESSSEEVSSKS